MEKQITIALIDDSKILQKLLKYSFKHYGFKIVLQANNGQAALKGLHRQEIKPDVCILDINMPVIDGFRTARELAKNHPHIKILIFNSPDNSTAVEEMLKFGARGYMVKGSALEKLQTAVVELYHGGYYFSETVRGAALNYLEKIHKSA